MGKGVKIHGAPLQKAFGALLKVPEAPSQARVLKELQKLLEAKGLSYHARTIKRQLQGDIEYIPQILEDAFFAWLKKAHPRFQDGVTQSFEREKGRLANLHGDDLYVSPVLLLKMADAFLLRHKDMSRRRLALALQASLVQKDITLGLETLQAALSGKTQKVRQVVEEHLLGFFLRDGFENRAAVLAFLESQEGEGVAEVQKIDVGDVAEAVDAFLIRGEGFTKRQLALVLKNRLAEKGYVYHLSSIQSILEGITRKTRKVVLDTLQEIFASQGNGAKTALNPSQLQWTHYVDASDIPERAGRLIETHPTLTRRQIASLLQQDLRDRNFSFSLNTLQFILGGKTKRVKKVVTEVLDSYGSDADAFANKIRERIPLLVRKGRTAVGQRVQEAYDRLQRATGGERNALLASFLALREDLIRNRWAKRRPPVRYRRKSSDSSAWEHSMEKESEGTYYSDYSGEADVAYNVDVSIKRLVS